MVPIDELELVIIELGAAGLDIKPTRAMGAWGLYEIRVSAVAADAIRLQRPVVDDLLPEAKLALTARAYGAARRAFELAVDYAKERHQFGQPIGKFQAIQHKLANCLIALEGVRLTLDDAARLHDQDDRNWRYFANAAVAFAGEALRRVSLETQHAFGAIGYAEEHEAPRHFKRVHLDTIALGGAPHARRHIASFLFDHGGEGLPQYDLGPAGNALRETAQFWLEQNWSGDRKAAFDARPFAKREFDPEFAREMGKTGWIGLGWPQQFDGQGRSPLEQIAFIETMERGEAPRIGAAIQANALMMFGTPEQQRKYLPEILRGEAMHGMGYSEPQAGSDLAAMRTSAVRDGDCWVINGQKIWTTTWWGKYMFLAARTDPHAKPPHAGISMFILPMEAPGVTIRPATTMYDGSFANIFYDNVRIPLENLVGEVNGGWKVLTGALAFERGLVGGGIVLKVTHAFEQLRKYMASGDDGPRLCDDALVRDRMASLASENRGRPPVDDALRETRGGRTRRLNDGAMSKVFSGELMERFGETALDILGMRAALSEQTPGALDNGRFEQNLRHSLMWVISIGTNEIQPKPDRAARPWAAQIGAIICQNRIPGRRRSKKACGCSISRSTPAGPVLCATACGRRRGGYQDRAPGRRRHAAPRPVARRTQRVFRSAQCRQAKSRARPQEPRCDPAHSPAGGANRYRRGEFSARRDGSPRPRLRGLAGHQPAPDLLLDFRLWTVRPGRQRRRCTR